MHLLWLSAFLALVLGIQPDGYCNPAYPTWRAQPDYPLKHLTVIIRHGDRSPVFKCWPNSPPWTCTLRHQERPLQHIGNRLYTKDYIEGRNMNPGNCREGQLTEVGIEQQLKNGEALKDLYGKHLPPFFDPSRIYVRSTDVPRTFLSGEGLLYGLYPPNEQCHDSTITINTMDAQKDNMTPNFDASACPMLGVYEDQFKATAAYKKFNQTVVAPLENDLKKIFGVAPGYDIDRMFDCIEAHVCRDYPLPSGFSQSLYDRVIKANMDEYASGAFYKIPNTKYNWIQVAMGSFIGDVINNIETVATNQTTQVMALFSGHDTTVLPFVMAYNAWTDGVWPAYASMIRIELLAAPSGDIIRMYYNNEFLNIPGCGSTDCPYETFKSISQNIAAASQYCTK